jgi:hypothetical protein
MPQAIALASTRFTCFVFEKPTERFIRIVLGVPGQDLQPPIADQCLADQAREHRIMGKLFFPSRAEMSFPSRSLH